MVSQILAIGRVGDPGRKLIEPAKFLEDLGGVVSGTFPKNISIETAIPHDLWNISGSTANLRQALLNLCINARDAMPNGGVLVLAAENVMVDSAYAGMNIDASPGAYVRITISDTRSVAPQARTEPSTPESAVLTHSFLSEVIKNSKGFASSRQEPGRGAQVAVYMPAMSPDQQPLQASAPGSDLHTGRGELILVVDDEATIREITTAMLQTLGYQVITASDGAEAVSLYAERGQEIDLVLTDLMMPHMEGDTAIRAIRQLNPNARFIATSGARSQEEARERIGTESFIFLPKPYSAERLIEALRSALNRE